MEDQGLHSFRFSADQKSQLAGKLRRRFSWLSQFTDDELMKISFCEAKEPIQPASAYFDLSHPERGVIPARQNMQVPEGSCYVPKEQVTAEIWDKLVSAFRH